MSSVFARAFVFLCLCLAFIFSAAVAMAQLPAPPPLPAAGLNVQDFMAGTMGVTGGVVVFVGRMLLLALKDERTWKAIAIVGEAGKMVASDVIPTLQSRIAQAKGADSDGGAEVTLAERLHIVGEMLPLTLGGLAKSGSLKNLITVYGGQERLEAHLKQVTIAALEKHLGPAPVPPAPAPSSETVTPVDNPKKAEAVPA